MKINDSKKHIGMKQYTGVRVVNCETINTQHEEINLHTWYATFCSNHNRSNGC